MPKNRLCVICGKIYDKNCVFNVRLSIKHDNSVGLDSHYVTCETFVVCNNCMDFKKDKKIVRYVIKLLEKELKD